MNTVSDGRDVKEKHSRTMEWHVCTRKESNQENQMADKKTKAKAGVDEEINPANLPDLSLLCRNTPWLCFLMSTCLCEKGEIFFRNEITISSLYLHPVTDRLWGCCETWNQFDSSYPSLWRSILAAAQMFVILAYSASSQSQYKPENGWAGSAICFLLFLSCFFSICQYSNLTKQFQHSISPFRHSLPKSLILFQSISEPFSKTNEVAKWTKCEVQVLGAF